MNPLWNLSLFNWLKTTILTTILSVLHRKGLGTNIGHKFACMCASVWRCIILRLWIMHSEVFLSKTTLCKLCQSSHTIMCPVETHTHTHTRMQSELKNGSYPLDFSTFCKMTTTLSIVYEDLCFWKVWHIVILSPLHSDTQKSIANNWLLKFTCASQH